MLGTEVDLDSVSLVPVFRNEVDDAVGSFDDATVGIDGAVPDVVVEANDLLGSLRNLLTNAVQHNQGANPRVTVTANEEDDRGLVPVADTSPDVPDDRKGEIFGKGETGLETDCTGVGLYLARTLEEEYGGSVRVTDNDPAGSVFVVELPIADG